MMLAAITVDLNTIILALITTIGGIYMAKINRTGKAVHRLVNSNMRVQLNLNYVSSRRLAAITKDPIDAAAASEAERLLKEHDVNQASVDASQ